MQLKYQPRGWKRRSSSEEGEVNTVWGNQHQHTNLMTNQVRMQCSVYPLEKLGGDLIEMFKWCRGHNKSYINNILKVSDHDGTRNIWFKLDVDKFSTRDRKELTLK